MEGVVEFYEMLKNVSECQAHGSDFRLNGTLPSKGIVSSMAQWQVVLMFVGLGLFTSLLATGFNTIRKKVYKDKDNLDTDFDAGGKVSVGLTATTIVSQWTWAATLLQSSAVASKYGVSGPFWYAAGASIQILLFAMISVQLKIRAPGAKTFLQVIRARFGKRCHLVFCFFALLTNIIVTAMLMLGGAAVMTNLVSGLSVEMATMMVATVIATYTFIGGLGATFYVSYFNTAFIFVIMIIFLTKVYNEPNNEDNPLGSLERVYEYLNCSVAPEGNQDRSYLTMVSQPGLMFGIINIVGNFGTVFVDQSYWQSSVAAKPRQGVWGFLTGGITWFAVPFTFATTMGLAYIALSAQQGEPLLTDDDVNKGLVPPIVAQKLMGSAGEIVIVFMILMAVTSTGSAEVIAVTSILIYDIYSIYLRPYRYVHDANSCILCGRSRGRNANPRDKCVCISMTTCPECAEDDESRGKARGIKAPYKCKTHGPFRIYNDYLTSLKNWCLLWAVLSIVPLTLLLNVVQVSLGWVYLFMGVVIGSAVVPIALCMSWARLTGLGMIVGSTGGAALGLTSWLIVASTFPGGLNDFLKNTGAELSMLVGNVVAIVSGGILTVVVTLITNRDFSEAQAIETWENTRDIDSPLSPWTELYARDLNLTGANQLDNRPSLEEVKTRFKSARLVANGGALSLTLILVILWPAGMVTSGVFDLSTFTHWVNVSQAWAFIAAIFIITLPVINEAMEIHATIRDRSKVSFEVPATNPKPGFGNGESQETTRPDNKHKPQEVEVKDETVDEATENTAA